MSWASSASTSTRVPDERYVERLVPVPCQSRDRTPRLVEPALCSRRNLSELRCRLVRGEVVGRVRDERQLLREAVVQLARDSPAFLDNARLGERSLVDPNLTRRTDEEEHVPQESKRVACVDPL